MPGESAEDPCRETVRLEAVLMRKSPDLPTYVVVPGDAVLSLGLSGTTVVEGTANGSDIGRRTIKAWGKGSDAWFIEFTSSFRDRAGIAVGDAVELELRLADASPPEELEALFIADARLRATWLAWSDRRRREAGEHIRAAKQAATRERRAAKVAAMLRGG